MKDTVSNRSDLPFKVNQIICLEYQHTCLYGEVIQLIPDRELCWFRPICIARGNFDPNQASASDELISLHSGSDLLWPTVLFRPALDVEVISLLGKLNDTSESSIEQMPSGQYLNTFVNQVWFANKDKF